MACESWRSVACMAASALPPDARSASAGSSKAMVVAPTRRLCLSRAWPIGTVSWPTTAARKASSAANIDAPRASFCARWSSSRRQTRWPTASSSLRVARALRSMLARITPKPVVCSNSSMPSEVNTMRVDSRAPCAAASSAPRRQRRAKAAVGAGAALTPPAMAWAVTAINGSVMAAFRRRAQRLERRRRRRITARNRSRRRPGKPRRRRAPPTDPASLPTAAG